MASNPVNPTIPAHFAQRLLAWWEQHGRHDLPWQQQRTAYRVWLAEVMLQQTQVATVIPYYQRFLEHFPDLVSLAQASEDEVLALWSGLGYYSRGRNLRRCAQRCSTEFNGELPSDPETLSTMPGIGPSTARAILSQAHNQVFPILDGNVKRVMARHQGISGWPGQTAVERQLWAAAQARLPAPDSHRGADYTQAIMDLGATCCTPRQAQCQRCPVAHDCVALAQNQVSQLPNRRPRQQLPQRSAVFLLLRHTSAQRGPDKLWLERRPGTGIWAGLWCLPQFENLAAAKEWVDQQNQDRRGELSLSAPWGQFQHSFTHFKLTASVFALDCPSDGLKNRVNEGSSDSWHSLDEALKRGLPQPIRRLLEKIDQSDLLHHSH